MRILILGAGAWGTALAISASQSPGEKHQVTLWARDPLQARLLAVARENQRYLPGMRLPDALQISDLPVASLGKLADAVDLVIVASPMSGLRELLTLLRTCRSPLAWLCKGFEATQSEAIGLLAHEIQAQAAPELIAGSLSGPSFAQEVARGQPTALVAASAHPAVRQALVAGFHSGVLRVYANDDLVGVEVGGAVKNVLAIATGLCDGLQLGQNARAALITRGLAEMMRLGLALGARPDTFMGLSGLGDLVLTATGDLSRNRKVGLALAHGQTLAQAVDALGHVAEGVYCARTVVQRAHSLGVQMPIAQAVVAVLDAQIEPAQALHLLMAREPTTELAA